MPRFAYFDHTAADPQPVRGWLDTDAFDHASMPDAADLLELTDDEWDGRMAAPAGFAVQGGQLVRRPAPPPANPRVAEAAAALAGTVHVTCAAMPPIEGFYAIDRDTQGEITAVASAIAAGLGLPGGGEVFVWPDASGAGHPWPADRFTGFARAVRDYVYAVRLYGRGQGAALPSPTIALD